MDGEKVEEKRHDCTSVGGVREDVEGNDVEETPCM